MTTSQGSSADFVRKRGGGRGEQSMVPEAQFTSYYGRNIVKASPWKAEIPAYLFSGGVAAGSSLLAAGGDLTGRPALRRTGRLGAIVALGFSMVALVSDLGRPSRFVNMLRTVKLTSPMSVGTWILSTYGPFAALAAAAELAGLLPAGAYRGRIGTLLRLTRWAGRPAGLVAAVTAPPVAEAVKTKGSSRYAACHEGVAVSARSTAVYAATGGAVTAATSPAGRPAQRVSRSSVPMRPR